MLFTRMEYDKMYEDLFDWIYSYTPGGICYKSKLKKYQKELWNPIINIINRLSNKVELNKEEEDFLRLVSYSGPIYRIQNYNSRKRGYLCELGYYQSWSKSIEGVSSVSNLSGEVLLVIGEVVNGINLFGFIEFIIENKCITRPSYARRIEQLLIYEKEEEIVYPIELENVSNLVVVNRDKIHNWEKYSINISKEKWKRNSLK